MHEPERTQLFASSPGKVGSDLQVARLRTDFLFWALFPLQFFNTEFTLPVQEMAWLVKN